MNSVVLLLGGNVGNVEQIFEGVRRELECEVGTIVKCSSAYRSKSWGFEAADFLNQAVVVESELEPLALLESTQRIEERWGRAREQEREEKRVSGERYCSRMIDIDIIFYGDRVIREERLVVPHPLIEERQFVLEPLNQILPLYKHPTTGLSVAEMFEGVLKNSPLK
ncbi:MAG: 2-amino-4-hydroxy-6-hydroxymethyldihydropteridine diphosphokinase [Rikenellaceae bacterium]